MARRGLVTFGVGLAAGAVAYAALTTTTARAVASGAGDLVGAVGGMFRVPAAAAEGLPTFGDCAELRQWYVDQALPQVGPWGFGGGPVIAMTERSASGAVPAAPQNSASGSADDAVGSSGTGTNVQEVGVDEADVAKTDGRLVVQVRGADLVVTDVSGARPLTLSRTRLPGGSALQRELLLDGDHVVVVGEGTPAWRGGGPIVEGPMPSGDIARFAPGNDSTSLVGLDISDPTHPTVTSRQRVDGGAVSTREYAGGTVRVVVTTGYPPLDFVMPNRDRSQAQAERENRRIVEDAPLSAWVPGIRDGSGQRRPLLDCTQVRHPSHASGFGTISVLTFPIDRPTSYDATAITAAGDLVYSSVDRLYVATTDWPWGGPVPMPSGAPSKVRTDVHAFALDGDRTTYVASGSVPGRVKDRWSFDEYDGRLRVATSLGGSWATGSQGDNGIVVLAQDGDRLREVGRVEGLGPREDIQAVRWFDDLAVVVTFRQTDPLYTVDLSDPEHPRVRGALKITGFSSYLHPVGDGRMVGVGQSATGDGVQTGAQVSSFDLRDLAHAKRDDTVSLGSQTGTEIGFDPRTFSYLPEQRVLFVQVQDWTTGGQHFVAVHVDRDGALREVGSWVSHGWGGDVRTLPLGAGRVALVGDVVRVVDVG
jgi:hypothetical protein